MLGRAVMLIVAALGGNALLRRGERMDQAVQQRNVDAAAGSIAALARQHRLVLTHGNGPQVGLLALTQESYADARPYTLDVLGSQTQGMIGYLLEEALREALPGHEIATLLTQVVVDPDDPAFQHPTKPIGPTYVEADARRLAAERGWSVAPDGQAYRRVVSSPEPQRIVELEAIRLLSRAGVTVICAGGGGVPVAVNEAGACFGVEAVVDKDLTAALLARELQADLLLLLTDVEAVELGWGTRDARPIRSANVARMRSERFAPGTMGPKVEAACRFVEATERPAIIGSLDRVDDILHGRSGTSITPGADPPILFWDPHESS